jgi:hypothetical protein
VDAQTRDRVLALAGVETRDKPGQRYHHWWIPTAEFDKVAGFLKEKFGSVSTETDWKGVHFTIATKGEPVKFTVSALDLAGFGLALLSGPIGSAAEAALIAGRVQKAARLARAAKAASAAGKAIAVGGAVSKVTRSDVVDGETRDRLLRLAGIEVREQPPVDDYEDDGWDDEPASPLAEDPMLRHRVLAVAGIDVPPLDLHVEALVAAVRHVIEGETRAWSAAEAAMHPRVEAAGSHKGEFKSVFDRMVDALTTWSRGEGPADPFEGRFTREQMRETAKKLGLNPRPRIPEKDLKNLLFAHIRENVQHAVDRPRASFTLKGGGASADEIRQIEVENRVRAAYRAVQARTGGDWVSLADLRNELGESTNRHEVDDALRRLERLPDVNIVPESNQKALTQADRDSAVRIGDQNKHAITIGDPSPRPVPKPGALRDLDVGVYVENKPGSKIFLRREKDGKPGSIVASFADLDEMHSWAQEHGETELAGWAAKERDGVKPAAKVAKKAAPAKKAPSGLGADPRERRTDDADLVKAYRELRSSMLGKTDHDFGDATDADLKDLRDHIQSDPRRDRLYDQSIAAVDAELAKRGIPAKAEKRVPAKKAAPVKKAAPKQAAPVRGVAPTDVSIDDGPLSSGNLGVYVDGKIVGLVHVERGQVDGFELYGRRGDIPLDSRDRSEVEEQVRRVVAAEKTAQAVRSSLSGSHTKSRTSTTAIKGWYDIHAGWVADADHRSGAVRVDYRGHGSGGAGASFDDASSTLRASELAKYRATLEARGFHVEVGADGGLLVTKGRATDADAIPPAEQAARPPSVALARLPGEDDGEYGDRVRENDLVGAIAGAGSRQGAIQALTSRRRDLLFLVKQWGIQRKAQSSTNGPKDRTKTDAELADAVVAAFEIQGGSYRLPGAGQAAADRQALVDKARSAHTALAEVEELLANGASDRALSHSITARGKLGTPPKIRDRLLAAVGDEAAMRQVIADIRREEGLTPIGAPGDVVPFDPERHRSIGGDIPRGAPVTVVRPGGRFERDGLGPNVLGEEGATFPADVQEGVADAPEPPARPKPTSSSTPIVPTPTPPDPQSPWGKVRDDPTVAWNSVHGRPGNLDQVDRVYTAPTRQEAREFLDSMGRGRLEAVADAVEIDVSGLDPDRDRAAYIDRLLDGIREPEASPSAPSVPTKATPAKRAAKAVSAPAPLPAAADVAKSRADLDGRLANIGRRTPTDPGPLSSAATRLASGDSAADVAKELRAAAKSAVSTEDAETLRLLAADLTKKRDVLPYMTPEGNVDLLALATHANVDLSQVYDADRVRFSVGAFSGPVDQHFPFSDNIERIAAELQVGKIGRTVAVRRLREDADLAEKIAQVRRDDPRRFGNYDQAQITYGPVAARAFRELAVRLEAAKIPPKKRAASLGGTTLGDVVEIDEARFAEYPIHGGLITHRGESVPASFRHRKMFLLSTPAEHRPQRPGLSPAENQALDEYTVGRVARAINGSLRRGKNAHGDIREGDIGRVDLDELQRNMDSAIDASELAHDSVLWRGVLLKAPDLRRLVPGAIYSDGGYTSTAAKESGARAVIDHWRRHGKHAGKPVLFKILAPAGTHGAVGHEGVDEVVLGRAQELRVVRVDDTGEVPVIVLEAIQPPASNATRGRHLLDEFDFEGLASRLPASTARRGTGDEWLAAIQDEQGFNGPAQVATPAELDAAVADGATELFRGVRTPEMAEQFRTGTLYPGDPGLFGSGTYASPSRSVATGYGNGNNAAVLRMALRRDARVISYADLLKLRAKHGGTAASRSLAARQAAALAAVDPNDTSAIEAILREFESLRSRQSPRSRITADEGRLAALLGYDAISVPNGRRLSRHGLEINEAEYVIVNRTALLVEGQR